LIDGRPVEHGCCQRRPTPRKFKEIAETAKKNCSVSKVLAAAEITLDAKLV
jgi:organic hydroperoxide reductase OsmC/OhrA